MGKKIKKLEIGSGAVLYIQDEYRKARKKASSGLGFGIMKECLG